MSLYVNNDPDGLECYSDHVHDVKTKGSCDYCGSTVWNVIGHVLPHVERYKDVDPVKAAAIVMQTKSAKIFDGVMLDHFTASAIHAVHEALSSESAKAKLRAMSLTQAATVCFKLISKEKS